MRRVIDRQMKLGEVDISQVEFDVRSRDEIPQLLMGLQYIYCDPGLRSEVFAVLEEAIPCGRSETVGRPGMDLWRILVLGTVKLNCGWDYDKVKEMADNHLKIREMLGHVPYFDRVTYPLQTLRDNVSLLTPELLEKVNVIAVQAGHSLVKKKGDDGRLEGRCDSFVVETDVHYPTDINLLLDAMRKVIVLVARLCTGLDLPGWRQSHYNAEKVRRLCRKIGRMKRSTAKDEHKRAKRDEQIREAYQAYLDMCEEFVERAEESLMAAVGVAPEASCEVAEIRQYIDHARRQMDQVQRRVLAGEKIGHDEKVFSIFEEHTEWISKGKAGVPQELGLRVCILEDQYGFVLHHMVMEKQTDDRVAVPMIEETLANFPDLAACSFDKGFYSPTNREELRKLLGSVVMPKKGRLSAADKEVEYSPKFIEARRKHSAVESGINALENHGLSRCRDSAIEGFRSYVGLAMLARNIQKLGRVLLDREREHQRRIECRQQTDTGLANAA